MRILPKKLRTLHKLLNLGLVSRLVTLIAISCLLLGSGAWAQASSNGEVKLKGQLEGSQPNQNQAAKILAPVDGAHVSTSIVVVDGECSPNLLIHIYRNDTFAGSTLCSREAIFSVTISLVPGRNSLVARTSNSSGKFGPDSNTVSVFYDAPVTGGNDVESAFTLVTEPLYYAVARLQPLKLSFSIEGGTPPYAVAIDWGDEALTDVMSLGEPKTDVSVEHLYQSEGTFTINISGTDKRGNKALIQTTALISDDNVRDPTQNNCSDGSFVCATKNRWQRVVDGLWIFGLSASLMVLSFWLGERFIIRRLRRKLNEKRRT